MINEKSENIIEKKEMSCLVDWLSFTIKDTSNYSVDSIITNVITLDNSKFKDLQKGHYGYKSQKAYDNIRVYSDGNEGMGIHVQMSGSGCRLFEEYYKNSWKEFLNELIKIGVNFTRIDLAIDDHDGYLPLEKMIEKTRKREVVTQFRDFQYIGSGMFEFDNEGLTLNLGSHTSDIRFRIYDKYYQSVKQSLSSLTKDEDQFSRRLLMESTKDCYWIRFEGQFRNEIAEQIVNQIINNSDDDFFNILAGVIKDKIRFVEPSLTDTNKRRWNESDFWVTFLEGVEKLKISKQPKKKTIEQTINYVEKQYSPTLATILTFYDGDISKIIEMIQRGQKRMKNKHYELLNSCT